MANKFHYMLSVAEMGVQEYIGGMKIYNGNVKKICGTQ